LKGGPQPKEKAGATIGAHCQAETVEHLEEVVYTRDRKTSFIAAEAIRLGLPLVEKLYPAVKKPLKGSKRASSNGAAQTASKRSRATARDLNK
jgi:hypothetical protein